MTEQIPTPETPDDGIVRVLGQEFAPRIPEGFGVASAVLLIRLQGIGPDGEHLFRHDPQE